MRSGGCTTRAALAFVRLGERWLPLDRQPASDSVASDRLRAAAVRASTAGSRRRLVPPDPLCDVGPLRRVPGRARRPPPQRHLGRGSLPRRRSDATPEANRCTTHFPNEVSSTVPPCVHAGMSTGAMIGVSMPSRVRVRTSMWEPSWEPFSVDYYGRSWTPVDSRARRLGSRGQSWTPVDTAWRSTDQEVGCSSRPGRAAEIPCSSRGFDVSRAR